MSRAVDAPTMRQINRSYVIETIFNQGPLSRIEISQMTGLNKATVSSLIDELIAEQYVNEIGFGCSNGGRKPILLQINEKAGYCIGMNIQVTCMTTVLTDMIGHIIYKRVRATGYPMTAEDLENILFYEIQSAVEYAPTSAHGIIGAGIALPGMVNYKNGSVFYLPNIEIHQWDICARLSQKYDFPIFIDNDGNCGALFEHQNKGVQNLIFINVGIGIGTGLIINNDLYRGRDGISGEFGHTTISAIGALCACGNYGCWEQYASEQALLRYLKEEEHVEDDLKLSPDFVTQAIQRAQAGNTSYIRAFETLGKYLGIGIANVVNALNPELVIIGGSISESVGLFANDLQSVIKHRAMGANKQVPVEIANEDAIVLGAARLCILNTLLQNPMNQ